MKQILALPHYEEIWMDIPEYEGLYQGSNFYKVRSLDHYGKSKNDSTHFVNGKMLKLVKDESTGYLKVSLCKNGVVTKKYVHRLMAELFIPNPNNYPTVDHINRIRDDMKITNLCWAPYELQQENTDRESQRKITKEKLQNRKDLSKPMIQLTKDMRFVKEYPSVMEAERQTGIDNSNISYCCIGKRKSAGGYIWRYK